MSNQDRDDEELLRYIRKTKHYMFKVASLQAAIATDLLVFYVYYPGTFINFLRCDPASIIYRNMCYGYLCTIYARPSMSRLKLFFRFNFSLFGSWMFCYSLKSSLYFVRECKPSGWGIFLGMVCSRFLGSLLYSYLYFVDTVAGFSEPRPSLDLIFVP